MHKTKESQMRDELRDILEGTYCNYYDTKDRLIVFFNRIAREYKHDTKIVEVEATPKDKVA
jgi:hypothetical protein